MTLNLRLCIFAVAIIIIILAIQILKKGKAPVKYSLLWFLAALVIMLVAVFPGFLGLIATLIGFKTISNMVIGVFIVILLFITIMLTIIVSGQKGKITLLIQEVSMLKEKVEKNEK